MQDFQETGDEETAEYDNTVRRTVTGSRGWRKLHNGEMHNFYFSSNTVWITTTRSIRALGNTTRTAKMRECLQIFVGEDQT
jgi:hypothetical protein